jgi:regulator of sigma E protease
MNTLGEIVSFLIVIGIIIFIHESGHFSMAKIFGIPVATFSLGFGPRLFGFRYKETDYKVSAVPLGGYVKIHGMEDQEAAPDDPSSFYNRPRWQRFLVLFMGVGFNVLLAIFLITLALNRGIEVAQSSLMGSRIGAVAPDSPAQRAGLQPGDRILEINGHTTPTWKEVMFNVLLNPGETVSVKFERDNRIVSKEIRLEKDPSRSLGRMGIWPYSDVIVADVQKGSPADRAGLQPDDRIKRVNGVVVHGPESVPKAVQLSNGNPVQLEVVRNENGRSEQKALSIAPYKDKQTGRWMIGFVPAEPTVIKKLPLFSAFVESIRTCKEHLLLTGEFLGKLFQGKLSLKASSGPFDIARMSQAARKTSWTTFLLFIGTISFDIGLINLLPIPALDGGHLFFLILEGLTRREFSIKLKERVTMVGFAFLICVMVVVLYYDILRTGPVQKLIESLGTR